jgi:hypothetical protein
MAVWRGYWYGRVRVWKRERVRGLDKLYVDASQVYHCISCILFRAHTSFFFRMHSLILYMYINKRNVMGPTFER